MTNTMKVYETPEEDPYNKEIMCAHYEKHNADVIEYFKERPNDLLLVNSFEKNCYKRFIDFIGVDAPCDISSWENRV